jgi:hypothetical protein
MGAGTMELASAVDNRCDKVELLNSQACEIRAVSNFVFPLFHFYIGLS